MRRFALTLILAALSAGLAACGAAATPTPATGGGTSPAASSGGSAAASTGSSQGGAAAACAVAPAGSTAATTVTIANSTYSSATVQAKVGDVVAWANSDSLPHSATMDDGSCDTDTIAAGASGMLVFTAAGTYKYHCKIHPATMKDVTVEVK